MVFIDDILIYSVSWEEHLKHVRLVFEQMQKHQLYLKKSKCVFGRTQLTYLGHVISQSGVATDPSKTTAMEKWPSPTSIAELRGFLGLTGYYRRFVKGYGVIAKPLTSLLQQKGFQWSDQAEKAFQELKKAMVSTPVVALHNFEEIFIVETDACENGIGAGLMQKILPLSLPLELITRP